ncbi:MAG: phosphoribosylformylglycinamidine synthase subunit PurS [Rickettsiales bacterium]|nr:phosphoribosylformylglycinamidine synthase subunit PurS [Rickettsiales bacterium]
MKAKIHVTLKNGVLDPQGDAIKNSLANLGLNQIDSVTQGKYFEINIAENDIEKAKIIIEKACQEILSNPVIENYNYEIIS